MAAVGAVLLGSSAAPAQTAAPTPTTSVSDASASAPIPPVPPPGDEPRRARTGGGGDEASPRPPDLSPDFDPFAVDGRPPPRPPPFDPARPALSPADDPLAELMVGGSAAAARPVDPSREPWRLPGDRRDARPGDLPPDAPQARSGAPR